MNISTCLGALKEIELTKAAYEHFRRVYPTEELCISINNDLPTFEWAVATAITDKNFKYDWTEPPISFSENYNKAVALATKEKIVLYHNDMVPATGFLEKLDKNNDPMAVLGYTTIEPPVFKDHERPGKIVQDFGNEFSDFKVKEFEDYCKTIIEKLQPGAFFFLSCFKKTFDFLGGFDEKTFWPAFCEDDDFLLRLLHYGCDLQTTNAALVYHFVSRTSRFSNVPEIVWNQSTGSVEFNSQRNFIRKWGNRYLGYMNKKVGVFDIGYNLKYANHSIIQSLEPFARNLVVDCKINDYITNEQSRTNFDLQSKFVDTLTNQITVHVDCNKLNQHTFTHLVNLPVLLSALKDSGTFKYGEFEINVTGVPVNLVDSLIVIERK